MSTHIAGAVVAIPFSSGLCSFPPELRGKELTVEEGRNPFFIRSVFVQ